MYVMDYNSLCGFFLYGVNDFKSDEVNTMCKMIEENDFPKRHVMHYATTDEMKHVVFDVKDKFSTLFPGIDKFVPYISQEDYSILFDKFSAAEISRDELINRINMIKTNVNVFDIPIEVSNKSNVSELCSTVITSPKCMDYSNYPFSAQKIVLSKVNPSSLVGTYSKLCVDALSQRYKDVNHDYYSKDIIGLLVQKIIMNSFFEETDLVSLNSIIKIKNAGLENITNFDQTHYKMTLKSSVMASELYNRYLNLCDEKKLIMLEGIKDVLSGKKTLRRFLDMYRVDFPSGYSLYQFQTMINSSKKIVRERKK